MQRGCLFATAIAILCGMSLHVFAQQIRQPYQKWEYKIVNFCKEEDRQADIHKLGEDGWELVSTDVGISGGEASSCQTYYFKRPLRKGAKQPAQASNVTTPPVKPTAPQCSLPLEKAPMIRGLRLGMSLEELLALFPGRDESEAFKNALKDVDKPPKYGAAQLNFNPLREANKESMFDGISYYSFIILDGKVKQISMQYYQPVNKAAFWTEESLIAKLSETFGLPGGESWIGKYPRHISCDGFELGLSIGGNSENGGIITIPHSYFSLTLSDPNFRKIVQQRIEADQEKRRQAFKF